MRGITFFLSDHKYSVHDLFLLLCKLFFDLSGKVVDHIVHGTLHVAAGCTHMSAASEERCHLRHIYFLIGTHADLVLQYVGLIHENRTVHALDIAQLVHNAVQISRYRIVEFHGLAVHHAHDAASVHETNALHQSSAHDLGLQIGLLVKAFLDQLREMAEEQGLINARKHDSQDICFVPDGDYAKFIEKYTGKKTPEGDFVDKEGNYIGRHKGIIHYTIGQRRGLGIPAASRLYVCEISPKTNTVVLGDNADLFSSELEADSVNLISVDSLAEPKRVTAKIRYRHKEQPATAWQTPDGILHVKFDEPQRAITKGQAVVMYDGDEVVGGGVINKIYSQS